MKAKEVRFEITRLSIKQKQLEGEVLAILNRGCLPLEEAKRRMDKMEASGAETETKNGVKYLVEKRMSDGKEYRTLALPLWYPQYAGMDDVLEYIEIEKAVIRDLKEKQAERHSDIIKPGGCKPMDGAYIAGMEKVFEKIEEYLANKSEIAVLAEALDEHDSDSLDSQTAWDEEPPREAEQVFLFYPEFKKDYQLLKRKKFLERNGDRLRWLRSKKSLSEYFGYQVRGRDKEYVDWKFIEAIFEVTDLKNSFSKNGDAYGKSLSNDYKKWTEIKNTPEGK
jgi:hypothetical protein